VAWQIADASATRARQFTSAIDRLSVDPDHLYLTIGECESDIRVMDVEVKR
jgi:hypothetical protein